jgi:hypothetical protein
LGKHSIFGSEVSLRVRYELGVAWVINGLHPDDDLHQFGIMLTDVLVQLRLSISGSRDEHCASIANRLSDCPEEVVIFRAAPAPDGVCLMVDVAGGMIRVQHELFDIGRAEMEYPCFMVIDPNDGMKVMAVHRRLLSFTSRNCHNSIPWPPQIERLRRTDACDRKFRGRNAMTPRPLAIRFAPPFAGPAKLLARGSNGGEAAANERHNGNDLASGC